MKIDARPFLERLVNEKLGNVVVCFKADNRDKYDYYIFVEKGGTQAYALPIQYRHIDSPGREFTPWRLTDKHFQVDKIGCAIPRKRQATTIYLSDWGDD